MKLFRHAATLAGLLTVLALAGPASAQTLPAALQGAAAQAPDLPLPTEVSSLGFLSSPRLALYKPEGAGPFPAIVLLHQCGGLRADGRNWLNMAMLGWAKEAVARGYVALLLDSLGPRGVDTVCLGAKGGVNFPRGLRDALQAAEHLRGLPYVDRERIVMVGFSWGAMVGVLGSSRGWAAALAPGERFRAVAAVYPGCFQIKPPGGVPFEIVRDDIDRPLLVLMGDLDNETPAADCIARLQPLKDAGAPVQWHIYPGATHCWDCETLNGLRKIDFRGNAVTYRYRSDLTRDSVERVFGFFATTLAQRP